MKTTNLIGCLILAALTASAQSWNPYVNQGIVSPAPLLPVELNGVGVLSFNVGNSGSTDLPLQAGQEMTLIVTLAQGVPDNVDPLAALGGSWAGMFDWTNNPGINTYFGKQNQIIPGSSQGLITIQYKVTGNTQSAGPGNGLNVNLQPPDFSNGFNSTDDDQISSYTYVRALDYGDAPASYGEAIHEINFFKDLDGFYENYVYLGSSVDHESTNQPSSAADGDDASLSDDEDGVVFPTLTQGATVTIPVAVTVMDNSIGYLNAWIDWNGDGDFADAGEKIYGPTPVVDATGTRNLTVTVPTNAVTASPTFARFRFGTRNVVPGAGSTNYYGEVEDYQISILASPGSISGTVRIDTNQDNVGDGPLAGVTVTLYTDPNGDGNPADGTAVGSPATTGGGGGYSFTNLPAGSYVVVQTDLAGYASAADGDSTADTPSTPTDAANASQADNRIPVTLAQSENDTGNDFVDILPFPGVGLVKTAGTAEDGGVLRVTTGSNVVYRYHVSNTGNTYLVNLSVSDDKLGAVGTVAGPLAPGGSFDLYKTNVNVAAGVTNIGTVFATPSIPDGTPIPGADQVSDTDDAVVWLTLEIRGVVWKETFGIIDGVRTNDLAFPEVAVTLFEGGTNGNRAGDTRTDSAGAFSFTNVTTGVAYTVLFTVPMTNNFFRYFANTSDYVLADGPDRSYIGNDARFEALDSNAVFGVAAIGPTQLVFGAIAYVDAGLGTNDVSHPLSTAIDLRLIETANGFFVELCTVDEVVDGEPIILYVRHADGSLHEVGQVLSRGGSQRYLIPVAREALGPEPFDFVVRDESGATHALPPVTLEAFRAGLVRMDKMGLTLTWASLPGRVYDVYRCTRLGGPWKKVVANVLAEGDSCSAVVPTAGEKQAFFKIVMQDR